MRLHGLQPLAGFAGFAAEAQVASAPPAHTGAGGGAGPAAADEPMDGGTACEVQKGPMADGSDLFFDGGASEMQPGQPSVQELLEGVGEEVAEAGGEFEEQCELLDADDMDM